VARKLLTKWTKKFAQWSSSIGKKLQKDWVNVSSEIADADIIDVPDSDNENNNNYVDLDTVGGGVFEAWQQLRSSFFIFAQVIVFPYNYM